MNKDNNVEVLDDFDDLLDEEESEKAFEENSPATPLEVPATSETDIFNQPPNDNRNDEVGPEAVPEEATTPVSPVVPVVQPAAEVPVAPMAPMAEVLPVEPVVSMPEVVSAEPIAPVPTVEPVDGMPEAISMETVAPVPTVNSVEPTSEPESVGPSYAFVDPLAGTVAETPAVAEKKKQKKITVKIDQGTKKNLTFIIIIGIILLAVVIILPFLI